MGNKLRNTSSYETVVQLLALAVAILAPYMAFNFMDLELFSVSKSMFTTLWSSSINPWLCPPYVYLLINFIIVFIAALSFIHSNTIIINDHHSTNDHNHDQTLNAPFIEDSSLISQTLDHQVHEPLEFHEFEDTFTNQDDYIKPYKSKSMSKERHNNKLEDMFKLDRDDNHAKVKKVEEVVHESVQVVDKRELRKSRTFHEGGSSWSRGRKERYVRILSQQELDQRVEAFINKFKNTSTRTEVS